ncbi:uncharacterized protein LOC142978451 [Anticarsia gemmatalis]|uniref:uncharacterized protein LOC142978451 n=1 Tax=Anticarsia gemmatalis TaxID=129554 RepID=UPI003F775777
MYSLNDIGKIDEHIGQTILLSLVVIVLLPVTTGVVDCRLACKRCQESKETPTVLEVYCAMCEECKQRRREKMAARLGSTAETFILKKRPTTSISKMDLQFSDQMLDTRRPREYMRPMMEQVPPVHVPRMHVGPVMMQGSPMVMPGMPAMPAMPGPPIMVPGMPPYCGSPPYCSYESEESLTDQGSSSTAPTTTSTTTTTTTTTTAPPTTMEAAATTHRRRKPCNVMPAPMPMPMPMPVMSMGMMPMPIMQMPMMHMPMPMPMCPPQGPCQYRPNDKGASVASGAPVTSEGPTTSTATSIITTTIGTTQALRKDYDYFYVGVPKR